MMSGKAPPFRPVDQKHRAALPPAEAEPPENCGTLRKGKALPLIMAAKPLTELKNQNGEA